MRYTSYLSFDCANKSLAVCKVLYNSEWIKDIESIIINTKQELTKCKTNDDINSIYINSLKLINKTIDDIFVLDWFDCYDLLDGKKLSDCDVCERVSKLSACLHNIDSNIDCVIIEDQFSLNEKSRGVYYCIIYHYINKCKVITVKPAQKNKYMNFGAGDLREYRIKYSSSYSANKHHSKNNLVSYLFSRNMKPIDDRKYQPYLDDIADSFFQVVGYIRKTWS